MRSCHPPSEEAHPGAGRGRGPCLPRLTAPPPRSCMLQADSERLRQAWVQAVQASIASAYRESPDSCYSEVRPLGTFHVRAHAPVRGGETAPAGCVQVCVHSVSTCWCTCRCARCVYVRVSMHAHVGTQAYASGVLDCVGTSGWGGRGGPRGWSRLELLRAEWPLPRTIPRGWTARRLHPQAALTLLRTRGSAVSRVRVCCSVYRMWLATAGVVTVASQIPAGPASTWGCCSALSAQASTGASTGWPGAEVLG